jgi:DNA-binding response OmpR family regulator
MRVIVLEDDENLRGLIRLILERRGYEVIAFEDPAECPLVHSHVCVCGPNEVCADVLISDVNMLQISGLQFVESQRKKGCKLERIAFMSGTWDEAALEQARRLGCKVFHKPFNIKELNDWLAECEQSPESLKKLSDWFLRKEDA